MTANGVEVEFGGLGGLELCDAVFGVVDELGCKFFDVVELANDEVEFVKQAVVGFECAAWVDDVDVVVSASVVFWVTGCTPTVSCGEVSCVFCVFLWWDFILAEYDGHGLSVGLVAGCGGECPSCGFVGEGDGITVGEFVIGFGEFAIG